LVSSPAQTKGLSIACFYDPTKEFGEKRGGQRERSKKPSKAKGVHKKNPIN